jgi:type II secretory pathway pseudopilin PulG
MRRNEVDPAAELEAQADPSSAGAHVPRPSFSRRRLAVLVAGFLCLYLVGVFARQVGEAAAASNQADQMRQRNAALQQDLDSLRTELELIQQRGFIDSTARGYGLGTAGEMTVTLDPNAPPLPADAPGSAGIASSPAGAQGSPLEAWLEALFGAG